MVMWNNSVILEGLHKLWYGEMFVRVLVRRLVRFDEDRILTEAQGEFWSGRRCFGSVVDAGRCM